MKSPFFNKAAKLATELPAWQKMLEEADLCAAYAQDAEQCGRFCAACGLILTANTLCVRALESPSARCELLMVENAVVSRMGFYQDEVDRLLDCAVWARLREGKTP